MYNLNKLCQDHLTVNQSVESCFYLFILCRVNIENDD